FASASATLVLSPIASRPGTAGIISDDITSPAAIFFILASSILGTAARKAPSVPIACAQARGWGIRNKSVFRTGHLSGRLLQWRHENALRPVLPHCQGVRGFCHSLDPPCAARAGGGLAHIQRHPSRRTPDLARRPRGTAAGAGGSRHH